MPPESDPPQTVTLLLTRNAPPPKVPAKAMQAIKVSTRDKEAQIFSPPANFHL